MRSDVMLWITGVSFFLSCLISLKPLMFLGEAPRYAEHTVMLQVILCVVLVKTADLDALLWLVLRIFAGCVLVQRGKLSPYLW